MLVVTVNQRKQELHISEPRINDRIRVPEVRLVGPAGEQVGIVRIEDALRLASESDLDLVEVAPMAKPPVAKLMDFGKYKYEAAVKAREARKNQTNTVLKEVRFRLKIDTHDYETKTGHARRFLSAGDKVKAMIQFRGREQQRPEMGIRLLQKFAEDVSDVGSVESNPRIDGRNMVMVIGPVKNKAEAKAEARRSAQKSEPKTQKAPKERVDVSKGEAPMTQSLGETMPEGLKSMGSEGAGSPASTSDSEKPKTKPATERTEAEPAEKPETKAATGPTEAKPAEEPAAPKPAGKPAAPKSASTTKSAGKTTSSQSKPDADK